MPETENERKTIEKKIERSFKSLSEKGALTDEEAKTDSLDEKVQAMHETLDGYKFQDEIAVVASEMVATVSDAEQFAQELVTARGQVDGQVTLTKKTGYGPISDEKKQKAEPFDGADRQELQAVAKQLKTSEEARETVRDAFSQDKTTQTFGSRLSEIRDQVVRSNGADLSERADEKPMDETDLYDEDDPEAILEQHVRENEQNRLQLGLSEPVESEAEARADEQTVDTEEERVAEIGEAVEAAANDETARRDEARNEVDDTNEVNNSIDEERRTAGQDKATGEAAEEKKGESDEGASEDGGYEQDQQEQTEDESGETSSTAETQQNPTRESFEQNDGFSRTFDDSREGLKEEMKHRAIMLTMTSAQTAPKGLKAVVDGGYSVEDAREVLVGNDFVDEQQFDRLLEQTGVFDKNKDILQAMNDDESTPLNERFKNGLQNGYTPDTLLQVAYEEQLADKETIWTALEEAQKQAKDESWTEWFKRVGKTGAGSATLGPGRRYFEKAAFGETSFEAQDKETRRELVDIADGIDEAKKSNAAELSDDAQTEALNKIPNLPGEQELMEAQSNLNSNPNFDFSESAMKASDIDDLMEDLTVHELAKKLEEDEQVMREFLKEKAPGLTEEQIEEFSRRLNDLDADKKRYITQNIAKGVTVSGSAIAGGAGGGVLASIIGGGMASGVGLGMIGALTGVYASKKGVDHLGERWSEKEREIIAESMDEIDGDFDDPEKLAEAKEEMGYLETFSLKSKAAWRTGTSAIGDAWSFAKDFATSSDKRSDTMKTIKEKLGQLKDDASDAEVGDVMDFIAALGIGSATAMGTGQVLPDIEEIYADTIGGAGDIVGDEVAGPAEAEAEDMAGFGPIDGGDLTDETAVDDTAADGATETSEPAGAEPETDVTENDTAGGQDDGTGPETDTTEDDTANEQSGDERSNRDGTDETVADDMNDEQKPWANNEELTEQEYNRMADIIGNPEDTAETNRRFAEALIQHGEADARAFLDETTDFTDEEINTQIELFQETLKSQIGDETMETIASTLDQEGSVRENVRKALLNHDRETVENVLIANGSSAEEATNIVENIAQSPEYQADAVLGEEAADGATYAYFSESFDSWQEAVNNNPEEFKEAFERLQAQTDETITPEDTTLFEGTNGQQYLARSA